MTADSPCGDSTQSRKHLHIFLTILCILQSSARAGKANTGLAGSGNLALTLKYAMLSPYDCMLNAGLLTMLQSFKGGMDLGGYLFKHPHFTDEKMSPWTA